MAQPSVHHSIIAVAGPSAGMGRLKAELQLVFDEVVTFDVPDDYGEFPDTSGYTMEDWEEIESELEDPNLFGYMTKCMDAALEFVNKREKACDMLSFYNIEKALHWPKFGGKVFAVTGHVTAEAPTTWFQRH